jgi:hypothetical protein
LNEEIEEDDDVDMDMDMDMDMESVISSDFETNQAMFDKSRYQYVKE